MANAVFSFEDFFYNGEQSVYFPEFGRAEAIKAKQGHFHGPEDWGDINYLCSDYNFNQGSALENGVPLSKDLFIPDDMHFEPVYTAMQSLQEPTNLSTDPDCNLVDSWVANTKELVELKDIKKHEPKKENVYPISLATFELLKNHRTRNNRLSGEKLINLSDEAVCPTVRGRQLSTEDVIRVASARYIQLSDHKEDDLSMLRHPSSAMLSSLTDEETKDLELAHLLLATAEKISNQQYDRGSRLLEQCCYLSSNVGNPVQRVVYYFAEALREKIGRETGRISLKGSAEKGGREVDIEEVMMHPHPALLASHELLPFSQVMQFTEIQAILDNVGSAKKIHMIDLRLRIGIQWAILMQALATRVSCPIELLKISAVGMSRKKIMTTSKWLVSFAETLNLPFSFKAVVVSDMKDIKEDLFEVEADEVVGVNAPLILRTMLIRPDCLENLMKVIKNLNPCIMIVTEVEANHNSPSFINRFTEALFFYSAWFDCLNTCIDRKDCHRISIEGDFFSQGIRSIIATEGSERIIRHVGIDLWRTFFTRFGFVETELSQLSLDQANMVVKQFACGSCCTLDMNGRSLIVGWKGTPLMAISAWKLH